MDYVFTTHTVEFTGRELELFIFGDIHRDTNSCDSERWLKYIQYTKTFDQKKCLYLGMGDYNDFASTSEKKKLNSAGLHETTLDKFDRMAKSDINKLCKEMEHMKGKVIGLIDGNHSWKFANGQTSDEYMAEVMQTKSLGFLSYIRINIKDPLRKKVSKDFDIVACHGKAGGKLIGTSINQVDDLRKIFPMASMFVQGHDHKLSSTPAVVLYAEQSPNGGIIIKQNEQRLCRSGSFKKTYQQGESSYEIGRLYQPSILGGLHATINLTRTTNVNKDILNTSIKVHV